MFNIVNMFNRNNYDKTKLSKDEVAELLKVSPDILEAFEKAYAKEALNDNDSNNLFDINAKQASKLNNEKTKELVSEKSLENITNDIVEKIVNELLEQTSVYTYDGENNQNTKFKTEMINFNSENRLTNIDINILPDQIKPQLSGHLMKRDIEQQAYPLLLYMYQQFKLSKKKEDKNFYYKHFRQGLDILDLDPIIYEVIGTNMNSMGNWFPQLVKAIEKQDFFKVPKTTIIKVPLTLLQLTRLNYFELTTTTMRIIDEYCYKAFKLDENKDYFIKTGTYSSKYDFRNAHIQGTKEVREIGEYLLFIHFQALQMASPLTQPCIYGVSTTNEWVVREFVKDTDNNPCIYKGLPLRTEYRVFVDFDTNEIIGINPYWDPKVMKQRFGHEQDSDSPHQIHDYVIYQMHEDKLMKRYNDHLKTVKENIQNMLPNIDLHGQWSIDVMENGNDFYIIDMALAQNSALIECVPLEKRRQLKEDWIPKIEMKLYK